MLEKRIQSYNHTRVNCIIDQTEEDDGLIEMSIIIQFLLFANVISFNHETNVFFFKRVSYISIVIFSTKWQMLFCYNK